LGAIMQRRIILVIAPSGSGKTRLVSEMIAHIDRVAVFDTVKDSQYFEGREEIQVIEGRPRAFAEAIGAFSSEGGKAEGKFKVVYHPAHYEIQKNGLFESQEFGNVVKVCNLRGHMYLVIDEAHCWCDGRNCPNELMQATLIGRHDEFSMILIAQRITGIHPSIRENTDEFYFWKIITPTGLKMVEEYCGEETAKRVAELRAVELDEHDRFKAPGQYLHWSKFKGIVEVTE
jgi:hypothetical protein